MITVVDNMQIAKNKLRLKHAVKRLNAMQYCQIVSDMDRRLQCFRQESLLKQNKSCISAISVILNA